MSGSLVLLDSATASTSASIIIGGGTSGSSSENYEIDSTYNVYVAIWKDVVSATDNVSMYMRVTKTDGSGGASADTTSNYDKSQKNLRVETSFSDTGDVDDDKFNLGNMGTGTSETHQGIAYLYNFSNASEYSFMTIERSNHMADPNYLYGSMGGLCHTVTSASNGLQFYISSGNIASGKFYLYGIKK